MPESPNGEVSLEQGQTTPVSTDAKPVAESSTPTPQGETPSMLDAVKAAISKTEASPASDKPDSKPAGNGADESAAKASDAEKAEEADDDDLSEDELTKLAEKTQRRFRKLVSTNKALSDEVGSLRTRAESFDRLQTFVQQNKLSQEDVNNTLRIAALMQSSPEKALHALEPIIQGLRKAVGADLDPELREQVRLGYITQPHAEELAKAKATQRLVEQREAQRIAEAEATERASQLNQQVQTAAKAADEWYADQQAKDPDFKLKEKRIQDALQLELYKVRTLPSDTEVKVLLSRIKKEVDKEFRNLVPKPKEVKPLSGSSSPGGLPAPKDMLEAVRRAAGQAA
jgi:hypothetical protein